MTRSKKTPWEKTKEKRTENIGFLSRTNAFRDPTPTEKASALAIEIQSWQATIGKVPYKTSAPYSIPKGAGVNLKSDRLELEPINGPERNAAMKIYVETPMDPDGILKSQGIDVSQYENPSLSKKIKKKIAKDPGWWEETLVTFLPLITLLLIIWMMIKFKEKP